ncbi:MAG: DUF4054 domain-containing protein [Betaproteobacteria bacterium]|nr:DUF4054 domain-containing protein [Betaproteobacteria bacterium]
MAVFSFSYATWAARYPALTAGVDTVLASALFAEACLYCDNTDASPVSDVAIRGIILNAIVAHIATLEGAANGGSASGLVGRVSSATQGSVTVATEYAVPGTAAWFVQTAPGASAWQMMAPYRTARYLPACPRANDTLDMLWRGLAR